MPYHIYIVDPRDTCTMCCALRRLTFLKTVFGLVIDTFNTSTFAAELANLQETTRADSDHANPKQSK